MPEPDSLSGLNRYRYARNNPLRYTDPSGHFECEVAQGDCQPHRPPKVRAYYLNAVENTNGITIGPNPNPVDEQGYIVYKMGETVGPHNVKSIPIYTPKYDLPLPDGDNTRWQMLGEMIGIRTWSPVVAEAIAGDFRRDYVPGDRLAIIGNSGGGTVAIEALDLLEQKGVFVDQAILRGSPVSEWSLSNVGQIDYIAANPPISDWKYYSFDINPFDDVTVQEHRVDFQGHAPPDNATRKQIGDLIADLMIH